MKQTGKISALAAALLVAGCNANETRGAASPPKAGAAGMPTAFEAIIFEDNETRGESAREFAYNWPVRVSAIPDLAALFTTVRDQALAEQKAEFEDALREFAGSDCIACTNRSYAMEWAVVADLPRFLSLSASLYVYAGGAHGNGTYDDLVWDREAEKPMKAGDFFTSLATMQDALGAAWCAALKIERTERLGAEYVGDDAFSCPDIAQLNVLLGSSGGKAFDRVELLAAPYVAGSYAEGGYEAALPVTRQVLQAVKSEYRTFFTPLK